MPCLPYPKEFSIESKSKTLLRIYFLVEDHTLSHLIDKAMNFDESSISNSPSSSPPTSKPIHQLKLNPNEPKIHVGSIFRMKSTKSSSKINKPATTTTSSPTRSIIKSNIIEGPFNAEPSRGEKHLIEETPSKVMVRKIPIKLKKEKKPKKHSKKKSKKVVLEPTPVRKLETSLLDDKDLVALHSSLVKEEMEKIEADRLFDSLKSEAKNEDKIIEESIRWKALPDDVKRAEISWKGQAEAIEEELQKMSNKAQEEAKEEEKQKEPMDLEELYHEEASRRAYGSKTFNPLEKGLFNPIANSPSELRPSEAGGYQSRVYRVSSDTSCNCCGQESCYCCVAVQQSNLLKAA